MEMLEERLYTAEELEDFERLDDNFHYELDQGRLVKLMPPMPLHGRLCAEIARVLGNHCQETGDGVVLGNDSWCLLERKPDTVRGPDVAVVTRARWEASDPNKMLEGAPDLVVEVASPSQTRASLLKKAWQYLQAGTALVWIFYPAQRKVVILTADDDIELVTGVLSGGPVLPGFSCQVEDLFG